MNPEDFHDLVKDDEEELFLYEPKKTNPIVANLIFWSAIVGGVAIGVILFLFFLTLFIYIFLPLALILLGVYTFRLWRFKREWKKIEKSWKD